MITVDELQEVNDPLVLFQKASEGISQHQAEIDRLAEVRARSLAELYAQGHSYRELARMLGMSAPRVSQLVSANDAGALAIIRAWVMLERTLADVAGHSQWQPSRGSVYHRALNVLQRSKLFDDDAIAALEEFRHTRNRLVHGFGEPSPEEAERIVDRADYLNALVRVALHDLADRSKPGQPAE